MGKHIRNVRTDAAPTALCSMYGDDPRRSTCCDQFCPAHRASNYAEFMAQHSIDTIPHSGVTL